MATGWHFRARLSLSEPGNFFNTVRDMIDDMHSWYHGKKRFRLRALAGEFRGIHVHDSINVFDKAPRLRPTHSRVQK